VALGKIPYKLSDRNTMKKERTLSWYEDLILKWIPCQQIDISGRKVELSTVVHVFYDVHVCTV
jgi:hypothetical protein